MRFVAQTELEPGEAYEAHIARTGRVPTRDNLHDFFNGLCWLRYPRTKQRLNRLQAAEIRARGVGAVRGPVRDALTLFDENAALLQAPDAVWDALAARDWRRLFVERRALWSGARLRVFGHAALEQLHRPFKGITAHVWRIPLGLEDPADWDAWLARDLTAERLRPKPFLPLPLLGVPGWWPANEAATFYDDPRVFRPARPARNPAPASGDPGPCLEFEGAGPTIRANGPASGADCQKDEKRA